VTGTWARTSTACMGDVRGLPPDVTNSGQEPIMFVAFTVFIVTTTAAATSENVVLGKPVTLNGVSGVGPSFPGAPLAPAWTLTDGKFLPESTWWQSGSVWWDENYPAAVGNSIIIDLLGSYQLSSFTVQVDNNDTYRLEYRDA
jgi:hypothetical protein